MADFASRLGGDPDRVGDYYDRQLYNAELSRLAESTIEHHITVRYLDRFLRAGMVIADVGIGGGQYSELAARRGCHLHLVDISERLLHNGAERLARAGLSPQIAGVHYLSATALKDFGDQTLDAALMLGPFYHLTAAEDRRQAATEAHRIIRPGGLLFAAGINRLAFLRDNFRLLQPLSATRESFVRDASKGWYDRYLRDGNLDPEHAPPIGFAHLTTVDDFRALFQGLFREEMLAGTESFAAVWQDKLGEWKEDEQQIWLDLIEQTGRTPEGLAAADHFLFIGRRV